MHGKPRHRTKLRHRALTNFRTALIDRDPEGMVAWRGQSSGNSNGVRNKLRIVASGVDWSDLCPDIPPIEVESAQDSDAVVDITTVSDSLRDEESRQEDMELADPEGPGTYIPERIIFPPGEFIPGVSLPRNVGRILVPHSGLFQSIDDTFRRPYDEPLR